MPAAVAAPFMFAAELLAITTKFSPAALMPRLAMADG